MENKINTNYQSDNNYRLDNMHRRLFNSLRKTRKEQAQIDFRNWLYTEVDNVIVEDTLNKLSDNIITNLKLEGFIVNTKPFRDEMASLIYYNSRTE